ncbi:protein adenylyltransferase SelO [Aestuariivirga sp.]|uniref:protein adenylyltransferase SelO n=1 Tax=Aestuariivirga sp. TaxID=2650926 RepID=UPI0039E2933B
MTQMIFPFDNSYARDLPGFHVEWKPAAAPEPKLVKFNAALASELGLDATALEGEVGAAVFSGAAIPEGATPIAQAYAGHQFGGFSPQLGDGRALLLGEIVTPTGQRFDIQLKGSGRTPFARGGDGKAAIGPMLREYLVSEAMAALGIPTTRALAVTLTGETIYRDSALPGAVLTRIAASHIRIGTFQFFAARSETDKVKQLADYAIARHFPELVTEDNPSLALLARVRTLQAALVAQWLSVGFIHGVMNTDNAAISGETIDYGPCAFMDAYDPRTVFSSIDHQGRYAYGNQPLLTGWNVARFAETLLPLIDADQERAVALATQCVEGFEADFHGTWTSLMRRKLGLAGEDAGDATLIADYLVLLEQAEADFTLSFRHLAGLARGEETEFFSTAFAPWLARWRPRLHAASALDMDGVNPLYIPRNHLVEEALAAATQGGMAPFNELLALLQSPFDEQPGKERYAEPAAKDPSYRTFCGT